MRSLHFGVALLDRLACPQRKASGGEGQKGSRDARKVDLIREVQGADHGRSTVRAACGWTAPVL
jgi:hypothetical protein